MFVIHTDDTGDGDVSEANAEENGLPLPSPPSPSQNGNYRFGEHAIAPTTAIKEFLVQLNEWVCNVDFDSLGFVITAPTGCCAGFQW